MKMIRLYGFMAMMVGGVAFWSVSHVSVAKNNTVTGMMSMDDKQDRLKNLTPLQRSVTQDDGTEAPFKNAYWDNKDPGIYVDVVSGEPLFSSIDKYESGTGWPSFTRPIQKDAVLTKTDFKMFLPRTEVRSIKANSHLGHMFKDGPKDQGGLRFCMNSAAMRFVHKDDLGTEGYGEFSKLFEE